MSQKAAAGAVARVPTSFLRNPYWRHPGKVRDAQKQFYRDLKRARGGLDAFGKPIYTPRTWNIVKGDLVQVTSTSPVRDNRSGKVVRNEEGRTMAQSWLGQQGVVLRVLRNEERIVVKGVNMNTRVARPNEQATGYFYQMESPIPYAQVSLVDPATGKPVEGKINRVNRGPGLKGKDRYVADTRTLIPTPDNKPVKSRITNSAVDTAPQDVLEVTYVKPDFHKLPQYKRNQDGSVAKDEKTGEELLEDEDIELRAARTKF